LELTSRAVTHLRLEEDRELATPAGLLATGAQ
jgi:hypothetical protein